MNYFLDTEFIEGFHKPFFGKRRHFIDLISIGIVAADGREYYAVSKDFSIDDADDWVKENVLKPIFWELCLKDDEHQAIGMFSMWGGGWDFKMEFKRLLKKYGKSTAEIANDVLHFINPHWLISDNKDKELWSAEQLRLHNAEVNPHYWDRPFFDIVAGRLYAQPTFYAYYADYDWVVFCSLFGRMIDLPKGFPMYCRDLKQTMDEVAKKWAIYAAAYHKGGHEDILDHVKKHKDFPAQKDEHNALADAKWNKLLYEFLQAC